MTAARAPQLLQFSAAQSASTTRPLIPFSTPCGHLFCIFCILQWLPFSSPSSCPICKASISFLTLQRPTYAQQGLDDVVSPRSSLSCRTCSKRTVSRPVSPCGHLHCWRCIFPVLEQDLPRCPACYSQLAVITPIFVDEEEDNISKGHEYSQENVELTAERNDSQPLSREMPPRPYNQIFVNFFGDTKNESSQPEQVSEENFQQGVDTNIGERSVTPLRRVETYDTTIERLETRYEVKGLRVDTIVSRSTRVVTVLRRI